jgi:ribosomal protein S6|tara:strand:+ start:2621 stop:2923 length:303 start_codon:yes stop_codon:yes gene_type:complete
MPDQTNQNSYNCILIFKEMTNKTNFQLLAFSYAQVLKQLGAKDINAYNKESYNLAYPIQKSTNVKFIEFSFGIAPEALDLFTRKLRLDESLLRFFLTKID